MHAIDLETLSVGDPVPTDLFDSEGELLLRSGHVLRTIDLTINRDRISAGIFSRTPLQSAEATGDHTLTVNDLREGQTLRGDIVDANGVLLLAGGAVITERFIERLKARGIAEVTERGKDPAPQPTFASTASEPKVDAVHPSKPSARATRTPPARRNPHQFAEDVSALRKQHAPLDELYEFIRGGQHDFERAVNDVKMILNDVATGRPNSGQELEDVVYALSTTISHDAGLAAFLMNYKLNTQADQYQHAVRTSMVAMRVAAQLEFTGADVMDIGISAMLQDVGKLRLPPEIRNAQQLLGLEKQQFEQHPHHAIEMLESMTGLRSTVRTVVLQAHERADGSGFPRGRSGMFVHPLARVLAPVATYVGLIHDRTSQPAIHPHDAMMKVLAQAKRGRFDKEAIRGMLESIALYPVGTFVNLSTNKVAQVVRCNPTHYARPVVVALTPDGTLAKRETDLVKRPRTQIVSTAPTPNPLPSLAEAA